MGATVLDIGCGKTLRKIYGLFPNINYVGIDINDHFVGDGHQIAGSYITIKVDEFQRHLADAAGSYDAVISSHNLEHIEQRDEALVNTIRPVKKGGIIYLSFPSSRSLVLPKRSPFTLNY
jgi:2-polyprenyl-3-methyl-5-hydroxy-6-metoxy-1,4-benzoquinol methylase